MAFVVKAERYAMLTKVHLDPEEAAQDALANRRGQQIEYGVDVVEGPMLANPNAAKPGSTEEPRMVGEQTVLKTKRAARVFDTSQRHFIPVSNPDESGGDS